MKKNKTQIRVRIAPSPTGKLHIGVARTALFNYLFAKKNKGKFILRFEDTDKSRSTLEFENKITESLKWLGLNWDEGPFHQMDRLEIYKKYAQKLESQKLAYREEGALWLDTKKVIDRFKVSYKEVKVFSKGRVGVSTASVGKQKSGYLIALPENDLILGTISSNVEDFVIMRQNNIPTYHFAVVVDDEEMKISHVIRGQDHFSNTPKHYLLQKALGFKTPQYAHIPLTLAPDRTKLSKRHGAVSISEYKEQGYLPEALINFMVLLGWHPGKGSEKEIFSLKELKKEFSIEQMGKSAAIFDISKLDNLNAHYIREKKPKELLKIIREEKELNSGLEKVSDGYLEKILKIEQTRIKKLSDIKTFDFYFKEPKYKPELLVFKKSDKQKTQKGLLSVNCLLLSVSDSDWSNQDKLNNILSSVVKKENLNFGDIYWPVRAALSGREASPSPAELLWVFGKEESLRHLKKALENLK